MKRMAGLTLVESLVVLLIMSVLAAMATPSFAGFIDGQRLRMTTHALSEALTQARIEALSRRATVLLVPNEEDWGKGWSIFIDADGDWRLGEHDTLLARQDALPAGFSIKMAFSAPEKDGYVAYGPSGRSCRAAAPALPRWGSLTLAHGGHLRRIKVNVLGRHRVCNPEVEKQGCDGPDP